MKHSWKMFAVMAILPIAAMAQTNLDAEVNAELEKMYKEQSATNAAQTAKVTAAPVAQATAAPAVAAAPVEAAPAVAAAPVAVQAPAAAAPSAQATVVSTQTVVAPATAATSAAPAVVVAPAQAATVEAAKQPTTVIEASPLVESGAEKLRKARQEAELNTEQNIVQKLEQSRLDDEKKRADVLFGDKFNQLNNQQAQAPAAAAVPAVAPVATQTVAAPVVAEKTDDKMDREAVRGEVKAALAEMKSQVEEKPKPQTYVGLIGGTGSYPDAKNVRGQGALGVAIGRKFDDRLVVEGSFLYSNYQVEQINSFGYCAGGVVDAYGYCYPRITNMNQYAGQALLKYQLLGGTFRPEIGALAAYTYRTFSDSQFSTSNSSASSNALDAGVMTGVSLELTEKFSLGFDFRYMWNMSYKTSGLQQSFQQTFTGSSSPIETMNYYTANIVGRLNF